jgi:hypothetical protein
VLFTKNILIPNPAYYNTYIIGIGIGTLLGNCVFIFGGRLVAHVINDNQAGLNLAIGIIFSLTALIQVWRMFIKKKDVVAKIQDIDKLQQHASPMDY